MAFAVAVTCAMPELPVMAEVEESVALAPLEGARVMNADYALVELQSSDNLTTWTAASPARRYWRLKVTLR